MIFIDNKYTKWYYSIINRAKSRQLPEEIRTQTHHIIPQSFFKKIVRKGRKGWLDGDPEEPTNKVRLTLREHLICHWLLTKMISGDGRYRMVAALKLMINNNKKSSRMYEYCNRLILESGSPLKGRKFNRTPWNKGIPMSSRSKELTSTNCKLSYQNGRSLSPTVFTSGHIPHNAIGNEYYFRDPNGNIFKTDNVTRFCKRRGLSPQAMCAIARKERGYRSYKGWTLANPTEAVIVDFYNTVQRDPTIN